MSTIAWLAQSDRVYGWDSSWWPKDGSTIPLQWLWVFAALLTGAAIVGVGIVQFRKLKKRVEPMRLYTQLAGQLGLSTEDRYTLYRIARRTGLANPITLLICPDTLEHHARQYASNLSTTSARRLEHTLERIHSQLFES